MNALFNTGIESFDGLFEGGKGIRWIGDRPPSILIQGGAGVGKTVLCSQVAAQVFKRGKSVVYFSLEQFPKDHAQLLQRFQWSEDINPVLDILRWSKRKNGEPRLRIDQLPDYPKVGPVFLVSQYPATLNRVIKQVYSRGTAFQDGDDFLDYVSSRLVSLKEKHLGLVILDSLPDALRERASLRGSPAEFDLRRGFFARLCSMGQTLVPPVPILIALETSEYSDWREFVADIAIELSMDADARSRGVSDHFLVVRKARNQFALGGRHTFRISPGAGIQIYANPVEAILHFRPSFSVRKNDTQSLKPIPDVVEFSTIRNMERFMVRSAAAAERIPHGRILRGSATLLCGEDRTRKSGVSASFIKAGILEGGEKHLYLVAGQSPSVAKEMLSEYLPKVGGPVEDAAVDSITIRAIDEYGEACAEIIQFIREQIERCSESSRIVVNDIGALPNHSELLPMLKCLFAKAGITSLFVQTVAKNEVSQYQDYFDNTIVAKHMLLPDGLRRAIVYRLQKYQGASPADPLWELRVSPRELAMEGSTLRHCALGDDGRLYIPPLEVVLFSEEPGGTKKCEDFVNTIFGIDRKKNLSMAGAPNTLVLPRIDAELLMDSFRYLSGDQPLSKTQVLCFDDPWVKELIDDKKLEPLHTFKVNSDEENLFSEEQLNVFDQRVLAAGATMEADKEILFAIPHHIDFGFYVIDAGLVEYLPEEPAIGYSWETLIRGALQFEEDGASARKSDQIVTGVAQGQRMVDQQGLPLFDLHLAGVDESFLCFVLEILRAVLDLNSSSLGLEKPEVGDVLYSLLTQIEALRAFDTVLNFEPSGASATALIRRVWYVSLQRVFESAKNRDIEEFRVIKPPHLSIKGRTIQAKCLRGDWFLGIIKNSPFPERGAWAIQALTSASASQAIFEKGFGLPTHQKLLSSVSAESEVTSVLIEQNNSRTDLWTRREIKNYHLLRPRLLDGFYKLFRKAALIGQKGKLSENQEMIKRNIAKKLSEMAAELRTI